MMRSARILIAVAIFAQCTAPVAETPPDAPKPSISPAASVVSVSRPRVQSGDTATLIFRTKSSEGVDLYVPGTVVAFALARGSSTGSVGRTIDLGNGTFTALVTGETAGEPVVVSATVNGVATGNSTDPTIQVVPGPPDASQSSVLSERMEIRAGDSMWVRVESRDHYGNRLSTGGHDVSFSVEASTGSGALGPTVDLQNGTYEARFTARTIGSVTVDATIDRENVSSSPPSISVVQGPGPNLDLTALSATPDQIEPGRSSKLMVSIRDSAGRSLPGQQVHLDITGTAHGMLSTITDRGDGTYSATYAASGAGSVEFRTAINGASVPRARTVVWVGSQITASYSISATDLGTLGGSRSYATAINAAGQIVGGAATAHDGTHAFLWTAARGMIDLGTLPGDSFSWAFDITDNGDVMGISSRPGDFGSKTFLWTPEEGMTQLPIPLLPGSQRSQPTSMNRNGHVVGWEDFGVQHAWIWSATGGKQDITAADPTSPPDGTADWISDTGWVVGSRSVRPCVNLSVCSHAFLWRPGDGAVDLGIPGTEPNAYVSGWAVNEAGMVTGYLSSATFGNRVYRWEQETGFTVLPGIGGPAQGAAVNAKGTVVGFGRSVPYDGAPQALAWPRSGGIIELANCSSLATGINDADVVVGWASCDNGVHAFMWTISPGDGTPQVASVSKSQIAGAQTTGCLKATSLMQSRGSFLNCVMRESLGP